MKNELHDLLRSCNLFVMTKYVCVLNLLRRNGSASITYERCNLLKRTIGPMRMPNQLLMCEMVPKVAHLQIPIKTKLVKPGINPEVADIAK